MPSKAARPNEQQRRFNASWAPAVKPSPAPKGKLTPRDREPERVGYVKYEPSCLGCGGPRERTFGLHCRECRP
jgi:hypothetical protein